MRIEIRLCHTLAQGRPGAFALTLPDGATVADALARMRLDPAALSLLLCNGAALTGGDDSYLARPLRDGDHLAASGSDRRAAAPLSGMLRRFSALLSPLMQTR